MKIIRNALSVVVAMSAIHAQAAELIANGGFESGSFAGWGAAAQSGSNGALGVESGTTGPLSGMSNAGPSSGEFFALSDQGGPGAYSLTQTFTVAAGVTAVKLKFDLFANNYADTIIDPIGLDFSGPPNQHARVDLLTGSAGAFDTGAGVIANLYIGADAGANPNSWTSYKIDLTGLALAGGTYQIRFGEVDNQFFFNMGVDNVSITAVPEPGTYLMMLAGLAGLGFLSRAKPR